MESINIHNFMGRSRCFVSDRKFGSLRSSQSVKTKASRKRLYMYVFHRNMITSKEVSTLRRDFAKVRKLLYNIDIFVIFFQNSLKYNQLKILLKSRKRKSASFECTAVLLRFYRTYSSAYANFSFD